MRHLQLFQNKMTNTRGGMKGTLGIDRVITQSLRPVVKQSYGKAANKTVQLVLQHCCKNELKLKAMLHAFRSPHEIVLLSTFYNKFPK